MEELLLIVWPWLTLGIYILLTEEAFRRKVQWIVEMQADPIMQRLWAVITDRGVLQRLFEGGAGYSSRKILLISLTIAGAICISLWAILR